MSSFFLGGGRPFGAIRYLLWPAGGTLTCSWPSTFSGLGRGIPKKGKSWQRFLVKTIFRKDYMHEYMLTNQVEDNFMGIFRNTGVHACYMGYILTSIPDL